jgi:Ca-activated chloride channel family protein
LGRLTRRSLIALPLALHAQETFRVDVRLVRMLATVRNERGELAGSLKKEDFVVTDNGVEQEIALFEKSTAQPLSVAMLVDTSRSTERERRYEIDSTKRFLKALISAGNPLDAAALYSFNYEVTQQAAFTRRLDRLQQGLNRLKSEGATALYDAIYLSGEALGDRDGRRVMIVISDGGDTISKFRFEQALEALHAANAVLYSILVVPVAGDAGRNLRGENVLTTLSQWTGGRIFFPTAGPVLDTVFRDILSDLRTQYLLGYYPRGVTPTKDRFHHVSLRVRRPGYTVSARNGYFADSKS